ncbi:hypothetical protein [Sorangium sp. So ce385]|uniref:hypothetical protein n=1 Tax=Sorangium sp. So ce385 TaxID=3133308 RepID=UPI003F5BC01F
MLVPTRSRSLDADVADLGLGWDDLGDGYWRRSPPEQRVAGLPPEQVLSAFPPEQRVAGLPPEQRVAGLPPEQVLLALPDDVLRALSDSYLDTLSAETRAAIRARVGR